MKAGLVLNLAFSTEYCCRGWGFFLLLFLILSPLCLQGRESVPPTTTTPSWHTNQGRHVLDHKNNMISEMNIVGDRAGLLDRDRGSFARHHGRTSPTEDRFSLLCSINASTLGTCHPINQYSTIQRDKGFVHYVHARTACITLACSRTMRTTSHMTPEHPSP
jgi:hypothetical protein